MSAGSLIRDSLQRELLDTQTDHVEREEINEVSEDEVVDVSDETDLVSSLGRCDVTGGVIKTPSSSEEVTN